MTDADRNLPLVPVLGAIVLLAYLIGAGVLIGREIEKAEQRKLRERREASILTARVYRMEHPELFDTADESTEKVGSDG